MIEFGDSSYYFDFNAFDKAISVIPDVNDKYVEHEIKTYLNADGTVTSKEVLEKSIAKEKQVDPVKAELLKTMVEFIIDFNEEMDDTLGSDNALGKTPLSYQFAFNTLLKEGIIKIKSEY